MTPEAATRIYHKLAHRARMIARSEATEKWTDGTRKRRPRRKEVGA